MRFLFLALASFLSLSLPLAAQDVFTPQHVAKLRVVTEAVIAPDGTQVAYVLAVPRNLTKEKDGPAWTELHVVDKNGTSTPYITGPVNVASITWTPDGKSIAFLTRREKDEARCLYVIPMRGGEARKLLAHSTDIQGYSFSGDGKQIAFLATEPVAKAKKTLNEQGFNQEIYEEDSPFVRVWITNAARASGGRQPSVSEPSEPSEPAKKQGADAPRSPRMLKLEGHASELHFNPREDKLAVALAPNPLIDEHIMFRKVHIVDLKTGKATNLHNPGKLGQLAWCPEGNRLAMITAVDKHDPKEGRLWVNRPRGPFGWIEFTPKLNGHVESFTWVDQGELLVQTSNGTETSLFPIGGIMFAVPGEVRDAPIRLKNLLSPGKLAVSNVSFSPNTIAFIGHSATHLPEIYLYKKDEEVRRLTDSNPWLKTMQFAKQEVVKYKARDGLELEGILIRPLNEKPGQRYPLVLTVHGGPEAHYSNGWLTLYHSLGQVAAAKGMAVFYPNYRGSTGYGVEFSMKGQKDAGGKEFDDLVDGVDHLVKIGLVDPKKVGITGGSYGGYATAWGSTYYSDRFAAGVMFVGVSDWISCSGTTDIPQEMFLVHHRKWLWDDWDYFAKASPIKHIAKHKTPLLIAAGKNDPRVHPSQSLELYRLLKIRNQAPVRLVLYPGEGHGNRRTASRLDYNLRLLQWMEHYLKGPGGDMPPHEIEYGLAPPPKTSNASWDTRERLTATTLPWPGRGCPCCIGW